LEAEEIEELTQLRMLKRTYYLENHGLAMKEARLSFHTRVKLQEGFRL